MGLLEVPTNCTYIAQTIKIDILYDLFMTIVNLFFTGSIAIFQLENL